MSEAPSLPNGWALPRIGDVAKLLAGYGFPIEYQGRSKGDLPFFKVGDISEAWQRKERNLTTANHYVSFDDAAKLRARPLPTGSVVFAKIGAAISLNRRAILSQPSLIDNNCMGLAAHGDVLDNNYLFYFACTLRLGESSRASIVPSLRKTDVEPIPLPIPPLKEQHRIVAKIEELFSDLDAGVAALKRAKANLKRYRAAVLKAAVEGKLTEEWRAKHPAKEPASALLARILEERRQKWEADQLAKFAAVEKEPPKNWRDKYVEPTPPLTTGLPELPSNWCWASVQQVGSVQLGRQRAPQHHSGQHMRPYLRVANVFEDRIDISDVMEMNFTPDEFETYRLGYGDILLNEGQSMELVGRPAIYRGEVPGACFTNTLVRFRVYDGVDTDYALRVFLAYLKNGRFQKIATITVNIAHLGAGRFSEIEFPLPPVEEQAAIIEEVDRHFSLIDAAEKAINLSMARASRLRQSILKQAFEGKLVPQDPTDEPASVSLERLRSKQVVHEGNGTAVSPIRTRGKIKQTSEEPRTRTRQRSSRQNHQED